MSHTELWPILRIAATVVSGAPEVIAETAQQRVSQAWPAATGRTGLEEPNLRAGRGGAGHQALGEDRTQDQLRRRVGYANLPRSATCPPDFEISNGYSGLTIVTLPAGRAKLATRPLPIGSVARAKTIGIDEQIHLRLVSS
jgi:hypothetical protein